MAREFLLFLGYYGLCDVSSGKNRDTTNFSLPLAGAVNIQPLIAFPTLEDPLAIARQVQVTDVLADIERHRVQVTILARPQQSRFRKDIWTLQAADVL